MDFEMTSLAVDSFVGLDFFVLGFVMDGLLVIAHVDYFLHGVFPLVFYVTVHYRYCVGTFPSTKSVY